MVPAKGKIIMKIVQSTYAHLVYVACFPTSGDVAEWEASTGTEYDPDVVLQQMNDNTRKVTLLSDDGRVLAIGGVTPHDSVSSLVWFVTHSSTEGLSPRDKRRFWKQIDNYKKECLKRNHYLFNVVHSKNLAHIAFLKSLGATIYYDNPILFEVSGEYFYTFTIGGA